MYADEILGLEKNNFIIVLIILILLLLISFIFYLSVVFCDKKTKKIVERNGKYRKTLKEGWNFIFPLFDRVVAGVDTSEKIYSNKNDFYVPGKGDVSYLIKYSVSYDVLDVVKYYYSLDNIEEAIESIVSSQLLELFLNSKINDDKDFLKVDKTKTFESIQQSFTKYGINLVSINLISIGSFINNPNFESLTI